MRLMKAVPILLLCAGMLTMGCSRDAWLGAAAGAAAVGAGIAGYQYVQGDLEGVLDGDLGEVYDASRAALVERGYTITEQDLQASEATIEATGMAPGEEDEQDVTIHLEENGEVAGTQISIRYGIFGDEARSAALLEAIQARV